MKVKILILFLLSCLLTNPYTIRYLLNYYDFTNNFSEIFNNNINLFSCFFIVFISNLILYFFSRKNTFTNYIFLHIGFCLLIISFLCLYLERSSVGVFENYNLSLLKVDYIYSSIISLIFTITVSLVRVHSNEIIKIILLLCLILLYTIIPIDSLIKNLFIVGVFSISSKSIRLNFKT